MKWLNRRVAMFGPYLTLCLNEKDYLKAMKHCKIEQPSPWLEPTAGATTHTLSNAEGELSCVVTFRYPCKLTAIEVAGLLVHEATHVWQHHASWLNERSPGAEQEAYAIQGISQELMEEFVRQTTSKGSQ